MSYDVVQFEDDGEICVLPTCWFLDGNVFLPPVCDKNLRIAIMRSIPPTDAWDEYPASRLKLTMRRLSTPRSYRMTRRTVIRVHAGGYCAGEDLSQFVGTRQIQRTKNLRTWSRIRHFLYLTAPAFLLRLVHRHTQSYTP
ncbi:unnamed protein product [Calicophoron daubneyi]|uniref:Uncharacterized protein n=1 Tax=Calicophoron daubneyi TaxID=300641 RepID=A0AAV2TC07_CALDB